MSSLRDLLYPPVLVTSVKKLIMVIRTNWEGEHTNQEHKHQQKQLSGVLMCPPSIQKQNMLYLEKAHNYRAQACFPVVFCGNPVPHLYLT